MRPNSYIGASVNRLEDFRFLTGRGTYAGDLFRENMLHAVVVRSPLAHGRIRNIDCTSARCMPGVHAIITANDIGPDVPRIPMRQEPMPELLPFEQPVIAKDTVRYAGEPMAVVLADSAARAEDAAAAVVADIDPLSVVLGQNNGTLLFAGTTDNIAARIAAVKGDAAEAFRNHRGYTRRENFSVHRHTAAALEPRALLAEWDAVQGRMVLHGAAKVPFTNRRILARFLNLKEESVSCIENDVGGGFGTRGEFYPEDFLIPFAARMTGRPVKWVEDRRENLLAVNHARECECELEIACEADGRIVAMRGTAFADIGAYIRTVGVTPARNIAQVLSGPYRIADIDISVGLRLTNKTPAGTYRGPGRYEADFFRERLFDLVADELGIDRVAFRRINLIAKTEMPYPLATVVPLQIESECDSGDYAAALDACLEKFGWSENQAVNGRMIDGRYHGVAVGCYFEGGASGPGENARIELASDGTIAVIAGSSAVGQGLETALAQIAADALEVPLDRIKSVQHGSTSQLAAGSGSYSSRSTVMGGSAVVAAAENLKLALRKAAAEKFGCDPASVELIDGTARAPGHTPVDFAALAPLSAEGRFASNRRTYSYGAHAAHVALDAETGAVEVLDYVAVEDVGRIVNPKMLEGQTLGAIMQGLGGTLMEHLVYDDAGQLTTASLAEYLMPTACDFPNIRLHATEDHPAPHNPLGAKGAGEGGIIAVGGVIANAIAAALKRFNAQPNALPLTPVRILADIQHREE
ncbi:MAG TPA: xanthine dehydrogenase family protein molybdopterin-binding subunit [Micropepsaceae bacterium]|nr:xanthine dehydrogenase family protein molybdopterin-binding subunit [Micropepsaceae bacterium]